jgi:hypothetical protein
MSKSHRWFLILVLILVAGGNAISFAQSKTTTTGTISGSVFVGGKGMKGVRITVTIVVLNATELKFKTLE